MRRHVAELSQAWRTDPDGCRWRTIDFPDGVPAGQWIALRYRTSLYDELERPALCLTGPQRTIKRLMPAALFGMAQWTGFVPADTTSIALSTTAAPDGWKAIELVSCHSLHVAEVVRMGLSRDPLATLFAAVVAISHGRDAVRRQLALAIGSTPMRDYDTWRARGTSPLDSGGPDAPRAGWAQGPHMRVIVRGGREDGVTMASLRTQTYTRWSVHAAATCPLAACRDSDVVVPLVEGDRIAPTAFAALAEYASSHPAIDLIYADEDSRDAAGRFRDPRLKPDWSPVFQQGSFYPGRALYFRVAALRRRAGPAIDDLVDPRTLWQALSAEPGVRVGHIRRVLLTTSTAPAGHDGRPAARVATLPDTSQATIIIPSKDRADLLGDCLSSLATTVPASPEIIIVDNGSQEPETRALYQRVRNDPRLRLRILDAPGPFNFSQLCNRAAAEAQGRTLVFLNNDTLATQADWLAQLLRWAALPDIGAVGARLLYPNGRVQHAGLVTGLLGHAAHIELGAAGDDPGYLDTLAVPREVSAVTGACLAVEKAKFDQVGGFDAERFPIELGDVDLCLRLRARGYRTIVTSESVLTHRESATRGRPRLFENRYRTEKENFASRWATAIRDDPYFHPALSVTSERIRLDH